MAIITYKHGIYELPHDLPNDVGLSILEIRKYQERLETSQNNSLVTGLSAKIRTMSILAKNS